jgi:16S rRNA (cytosine1402-N4)-methyltransferase
MDLPPQGHQSVLLPEVISHFLPLNTKTAVDCTVGRAGHSLAVAQHLGKNGLLIGLDADPRNLEFAQQRLKDAPCRVRLFHANFAELDDVLREVGIEYVDRILADLGVSTNQLFADEYGMSFARDMPLDMRLDPRLRRSAADIVNQTREDDLANILFNLAQERYSRRIARKIGEERRLSPIISTGRLADIIRSAIPKRGGAPERIDPATRTFLALRMSVNQEMENLRTLLDRGARLLAPGGRLAVISFQSMEDRLVKQAFRAAHEQGGFVQLTKKPIEPSDAEVQQNPRSRSAKMRILEKVSEPPSI